MSFIKIDRDILNSYCFANANHLKIWLWLLVKANYKTGFVSLKTGRGEATIELNRGQMIFGRFKAENELNLDGSMIYRTLCKFEELGQILIESNNQYSIITICKYDNYQGYDDYDEQPIISKRTANEQPMTQIRARYELDMNTSKEEKERQEEKEINISFDLFWDLYEKKTGEKGKLIKKWESLTDKERELILNHIPKYKISQPDKKYRKDPQTYLNNKSWLDEVILPKNAESVLNRPKTAYELEIEAKRNAALQKHTNN